MPDNLLSSALRRLRQTRLGWFESGLVRRTASSHAKLRSDNLEPPSSEGVFCVHPWIHLRLQDEGNAHVCCRYANCISKDGSPLSLRSHSFDELWNAAEMREIRRDMVQGRPVAGCADCYEEDRGGGISMRRRDNTLWLNGWLNEDRLSLDALKSQAIVADFRVPSMPANIEIDTGSLCNLKCRMCNDGYSSRIATDPVHRRWATDQYAPRPYHDPHVIARPISLRRWSLPQELEAAIVRAPGQVKRLYFLGGEPLLVKEVGELLQRLIDAGVSRDIALAVVSNGTVTDSWLKLAQHFKHLELTISVDGFGKHYEYIRYPATWEKLTRNLHAFQAMPNTSLGVATTLQLYNALNVCDLFRYLDSINVGFYSWPVHSPRYLSIEALPPGARRVAADRLSTYAARDCRAAHGDMVRGLADQIRPVKDTFDSRLMRDCMLFTNDLDASRGQSFADVNGELLGLLVEAGFSWASETLHAGGAAGDSRAQIHR